MTANVLTANYREYIKLQLDLQRAMFFNKTEPCPEKIKDLIERIQEPAQKLTEFEKDYAEWVLDLYHPETGLDIQKIKTHIKELAKLDRDYKIAHKDLQKKKISWEELGKVSKKFRDYSLDTSQMCALRAAMRGRIHFQAWTLEKQREWVSDQAENYRKEA